MGEERKREMERGKWSREAGFVTKDTSFPLIE